VSLGQAGQADSQLSMSLSHLGTSGAHSQKLVQGACLSIGHPQADSSPRGVPVHQAPSHQANSSPWGMLVHWVPHIKPRHLPHFVMSIEDLGAQVHLVSLDRLAMPFPSPRLVPIVRLACLAFSVMQVTRDSSEMTCATCRPTKVYKNGACSSSFRNPKFFMSHTQPLSTFLRDGVIVFSFLNHLESL
jgi:hypothetical protein